MWLKALVAWLAILVLAMLNGALRERILVPAMGPRAGLIASGAVLSLLVFLVAFLAAPWYGALSSEQWGLIGAFWLALTVLFEFGFGRVVERRGWAELLQAYTFRGGNLWPVVLVAALVSPWLAASLRGLLK